MNSATAVFSKDYATARERFRQAIQRLGWTLEVHPIDGTGPAGEDLTIDVGFPTDVAPEKTLVISSGIHGVEGFFGSAVQLALLEKWGSDGVPPLRCLFLHGLNPYGFAWLRRFDENNVDLNRNFLLAGETYAGSPDGYARFNPLLNPERPPSRWEPFTLKAMWQIARHGLPLLQRAIAGGQYEFPRALFFGGATPSRSHQLLDEHMGRWLQGSQHVMHLDFHTGLGLHGTCKLLIDYPLDDPQRRQLSDWFGPDSFEASDSSSIAYDTRGSFGKWCVSRHLAADYLYACAEFGTYGPVQVLAGLRAENRAHHWGTPSSRSTVRAQRNLKELFCPLSESWRTQVVDQSLRLVDQAIQGLTALESKK